MNKNRWPTPSKRSCCLLSAATEATTPWQLLVPRQAQCTLAAAAFPLAKLKKGEKAASETLNNTFFGPEIWAKYGKMAVCMMMLQFLHSRLVAIVY